MQCEKVLHCHIPGKRSAWPDASDYRCDEGAFSFWKFYVLGQPWVKKVIRKGALNREIITCQPIVTRTSSDFLNTSFFDIVNIEPVIDDFVFGKKLRNVSFEEFLEFNRHFADAFVAEFIVPFYDLLIA